MEKQEKRSLQGDNVGWYIHMLALHESLWLLVVGKGGRGGRSKTRKPI